MITIQFVVIVVDLATTVVIVIYFRTATAIVVHLEWL